MAYLNSGKNCTTQHYDGWTVYRSYGTDIAYTNGDIAFYCPDFYSKTTAKHQSLICQDIGRYVDYYHCVVEGWTGDIKRLTKEYGRPKMTSREWNELYELGFLRRVDNEYLKLYWRKTFEEVLTQNEYQAYKTYQHLSKRKSVAEQFSLCYSVLSERYKDVTDETELYPTYIKQAKLKFRTKPYVSKTPELLEALKKFEFPVELREKYLADNKDAQICEYWRERILNHSSLYDYVADNTYDSLFTPSRNVRQLVGDKMYDEMFTAIKALYASKQADDAYTNGNDTKEVRQYFTLRLRDKYKSAKIVDGSFATYDIDIRLWKKQQRKIKGGK